MNLHSRAQEKGSGAHLHGGDHLLLMAEVQESKQKHITPIKGLLWEMTCHHFCPPFADESKSPANPINQYTRSLCDNGKGGSVKYQLEEKR